MLILLSCAKTMTESSVVNVPFTTEPCFVSQARELAMNLSQYPVEELGRCLHVNSQIAAENYLRFQKFYNEDSMGLPALLSYTGVVFKRLNPGDFLRDDFIYAQNHLRITSFLYGLLRPLDAIKPYRLEGDIRLTELQEITLFDYWKSYLTDFLFADIQQQGGILYNLASNEMRKLFYWSDLQKKVRIITPEFKVVKNNRLITIVVYAKMARGEMARYILKNRITDPDVLKNFTWEGFEFNDTLSTKDYPVFVNGYI